ncbi:phage tail assembly chaperone [Pseudooceanicola nitratireducens]|uniref:rcc01693 family protein n=1 Tax=Pseudooceanicola nitratireducens TaxID=517719 RepID=UPI001C97B404|nr:rcc01693 family protein [Pseudooceanicola nitratireducens]MBY6165658.1 phage tail assembly chaperone [Pseudooceanicola nitratireducens]
MSGLSQRAQGSPSSGGEGFDWVSLVQAGVRGLGLRPAEFWALTPAELALMLGRAAPPALGRAGLVDLMAAFPDAQAGHDGLNTKGGDA